MDRVYRTSLCPSCGKQIKACLNCQFYSPGAQWDCRETISEPVREKDKVNFCDFFSLGGGGTYSGVEEKKRNKARTSFDSLFSD